MLSVLLYSTFTVQKLYSLQTELYLQYYTQAAATLPAAQQLRNSPADVFLSGVQLVVWNCVYIQTHQEIRSFKEIQMTTNALPRLHSTRQHLPIFLSGDCKAA
jgi:hypothetical protein